MPLPTNETAANPAGDNRPAQTANAANPLPQVDESPPHNEQTLSKEAEKYLREGGNIEDLPDAEDEKAAEGEQG